MKNNRWWLYILKLENGKWYVGITSKTPEERFAEHRLGKRAAYWTMRHKPIEIELIEDLGVVSKQHAEKYENEITRKLIKERGLNNVRGGNLTYTDDVVRRLGYFWRKHDWETMAGVIFFTLITLALLIDKFLFEFIPGGVG